jgi:hypothetical protein
MSLAATDTGGRTRAPVWFWVIAILATLWNAVGVVDYVMTQFRVDAYMSSFSEEQLAYFYGFPSWFVAIWAIAVFSAFIASIGLLVRKRWAEPLFGLAFFLFLLNLIYQYAFTGAYAMMGAAGLGVSLFIGVSLLGLLWFSRWAGQKKILR